MISKVIKELLMENKLNKLQTFGYKLMPNGGMDGYGGGYGNNNY